MPGNWEAFKTSSPSTTIRAVPGGTYEIEVVAIDALGNRSIATNSRKVVEGIRSGSDASGGIEAVQGAAITAISPTLALLTWTPPNAAGLLVAIRHTPEASGGNWGDASPITSEQPLAEAGQFYLPALSGCYLLRFVNAAGQGSTAITAVAFTQSPTLPFAYAANYLESSGNFGGTKTNCYYDSNLKALRLSRTYFDDMGAIDSLSTYIDDYGAITVDTNKIDDLATGGDWDAVVVNSIDSYGLDGRLAVYEFASTLDLNGIYDVELARLIKVNSLGVDVTWDGITSNIDDLVDIDSTLTDAGEISVEYSTSPDASSGAKWSPWMPLTHCYALLRSVKFRAKLAVSDIYQDIAALEIGASVMLPQRIETSATLATAASAYLVAFTSPFYAVPSLALTPFNLATGDYYEISSLAESGFSVTFKNSSGSAVARNFQYQAIGFGRQYAELVPPAPPEPTDPDFASVVLLLQPNNEVNNSTIFTDLSSYGRTLATVGDAKISTAITRFGRPTISFDGNGDRITAGDASSLEFGSGNFTIEIWLEPFSQNRQYATLISRGSGGFGSGSWAFMTNWASSTTGDLALYVSDYSPSTQLMASSGVNLRDGLAHFIQLVRNNGAWAINVDGVERASASWNGTIADIGASLFIADDENFGPRALQANIGAIRITKGIARANVVPSAPFPTQ